MSFKTRATLPAALLSVSLAGTFPLEAQTSGAFRGYVHAGSGLGMSGSVTAPGAVSPDRVEANRPAPGRGGLPPLTDGRDVDLDRIDAFNSAMEQAFPMTPEMIRRYRQIFEEQQRATLDRPEPQARMESGFIALEPGETPGRLLLSPGIASVISFYDATGQSWPIEQYVVGSGQNFEVVALGEESNSLVMTPLSRLGWSNLVVRLRDEPRPVVLHVSISEAVAHFRHDIQIGRMGPNAEVTLASGAAPAVVTEAGSQILLSMLSRVDIPRAAVSVPVSHVQAEAWTLGDRMFVRSRHALLSPSWTASLAGPNGVRVYEINPSSMLLFSVDGRVIRVSADLP